MALSQRYQPSHPPGEICSYAMDFSAVIPPGPGLSSGTLTIVRNTNPTTAAPEFTAGTVSSLYRMLTAQAQGGTAGTDYQFQWTAVDTQNNTWVRTALLLCAQTS